MNIKKLCIPSTEFDGHQLMPEKPPGLYDPDTQTLLVSPEMLKLAESQKTALGKLPESFLNRDLSALPTS